MPDPAQPTTPAQLAGLFRACAAGRREYLRTIEQHIRQAGPGARDVVPSADMLRHEAAVLDAVARVIDGDLGPLYNWLPSWRWTKEMNAALFARESTDDI
jgi:hypothetical protein